MIGWGEKTRSLAQSAQAGSDQAARSLWTQAAQRVRLALDEFKPDLIVALAQAPLTAETLAFLKKESDGLWAFWFVEDFRVFRYVEEVAPCYDLFFHLQGDLLEASLARWGLNRAWCLPPAADPVFFQPRAQVPAQYQAAVSLMGAGYPNRRQILTSLYNDYWLKSGHPAETLKIFGSGWEGLEPPLAERLFEGGRRVSPQECAWIYAGSQVNLNIHSSLTPGLNPQSAFVNPRTFELAACGALQLVDRRPLLAGLFSEEEVAVFDHPSQLPEKIEYYLARPKLRQTMGEAARARVLADHQYTHRLEFMIKRAQSPFLEEITG
jgi:spore maturation protein CgeB